MRFSRRSPGTCFPRTVGSDCWIVVGPSDGEDALLKPEELLTSLGMFEGFGQGDPELLQGVESAYGYPEALRRRCGRHLGELFHVGLRGRREEVAVDVGLDFNSAHQDVEIVELEPVGTHRVGRLLQQSGHQTYQPNDAEQSVYRTTSRFTKDVDIVIQLTPDNIERTFTALASLGYKPIVSITKPPEVRNHVESQQQECGTHKYPRPVRDKIHALLFHRVLLTAANNRRDRNHGDVSASQRPQPYRRDSHLFPSPCHAYPAGKLQTHMREPFKLIIF
jgi:hypothetical protein